MSRRRGLNLSTTAHAFVAVVSLILVSLGLSPEAISQGSGSVSTAISNYDASTPTFKETFDRVPVGARGRTLQAPPSSVGQAELSPASTPTTT
jgi:hypothetical protein